MRARLEWEKFAKVAALLDSPIEGERVSALEAVNRMLSGAGLRWVDLVAPKQNKREHDKPTYDVGARYRELAELVLRHSRFHTLNEKQRGFIASMAALRP